MIVHDMIMTVLVALIPTLVAWFGTLLLKYTKTSDNLNALLKVVDAAVVFAEKMGAKKAITGNQQFQVALNFVQSQLQKLGITNVDEALIKSLIEQSWAKQRANLKNVYDGTKSANQQAELEAKTKEVETQKEELDKQKASLEAEKDQVKSLVSSLNNALNDTKETAPQGQEVAKPDQPITGKDPTTGNGGTK